MQSEKWSKTKVILFRVIIKHCYYFLLTCENDRLHFTSISEWERLHHRVSFSSLCHFKCLELLIACVCLSEDKRCKHGAKLLKAWQGMTTYSGSGQKHIPSPHSSMEVQFDWQLKKKSSSESDNFTYLSHKNAHILSYEIKYLKAHRRPSNLLSNCIICSNYVWCYWSDWQLY